MLSGVDRQPLVVFDFDWSLINENSDTWVIAALCPELVNSVNKLSKTTFSGQWTKLMDLMVGQMMAPPYNVSVEDLNSALRSIPVFAETIDALKLAHAAGASVCILSDANQHYIDVILAHHGLRSYVTEIVTNESYICLPMGQCSKCTATASTPRLHISPFQSEGEAHGCVLCPPNLCKGGVLEQWRARRGPACGPIVYVGDGGGDYCPATRLGEGDVVLCRANWALHKCIREQKAGLRTAARVVPWADGADLLSEFSSIFQHPR